MESGQLEWLVVGIGLNLTTSPADWPEAVSYTHLDVYKRQLFSIMLATLFLPQVVLNVPQFLLYTKFGWVNSPFLSLIHILSGSVRYR